MMVAEELKLIVQAEVNKAIADMNRFNTTTQKSKMGIDGLTGKIGNWIVGMGAAVLSIQTLRKAMQYAFDAAQYAAQVTQIQRAFDNITKQAGTTSDAVLNSIREMSLGTISDLKLMQSASRAALFDIPMDKLSDLMHVAMASATATGESVEYMFESIVTGIGRASPMILDNLGLAVRTGEAYKAMAEKLGKTTEQLTIAERKQALLNEVLRAGGDLMDKVGDAALEMTDAQRWERMQAALENMKSVIGIGLLPAMRNLADAVTIMANDLAKIIEYRNVLKDIEEGGATLENTIRKIELEIYKLENSMKRLRSVRAAELVQEEINALEEQLRTLKQVAAARDYAGKRGTESHKKAIREEEERARKEQERAEQLEKYLKEVEKAYSETTPGKKEALEAAIDYWEKQLETANKTAPQVRAILQELYEAWGEISGRLESEIIPQIDEVIYGFKDLGPEALGLTDIFSTGLIPILEDSADRAMELGEAVETRLVPSLSHAEMVLRDLNHAFYEHKSEVDIVLEAYEELINKSKQTSELIISNLTPFMDAFGEMFIDMEKGLESFADAAKNAFARILEMLAKKAFAQAAYYAALGLIPGMQANIPGAIALGVAGTALLTAAGAVRALSEGGIVTKPTMALVGEKGPEAVIPLNRGGISPTIIVNVQGSVLTEEGIARRIGSIWRRQNRGY